MKSEAFWNWIEHATNQNRLGTPNIESLDAAFERLSEREKAEIVQAFYELLDSADRIELWQLCSLMAGQPCGDDSFSYFRRWLVVQGKEVFTTAMRNPDDLASFVRNGSVPNEPFIESIGLVDEFEASDKLLEKFRTQPISVRTWSWLQSSEERIRRDLPRMWNLVGQDFTWESTPGCPTESQTCDVAGLGRVHIGDRFQHKAGMGLGTVTAILIPETAAIELEFSTGKKVFRLSTEFFERAS